jgi:hypothetical protein
MTSKGLSLLAHAKKPITSDGDRVHPKFRAFLLVDVPGTSQVPGTLERRLLSAALDRAKPEGFVRLFVDEGEPLRRLVD